jgi:hypothetical protein
VFSTSSCISKFELNDDFSGTLTSGVSVLISLIKFAPRALISNNYATAAESEWLTYIA